MEARKEIVGSCAGKSIECRQEKVAAGTLRGQSVRGTAMGQHLLSSWFFLTHTPWASLCLGLGAHSTHEESQEPRLGKPSHPFTSGEQELGQLPAYTDAELPGPDSSSSTFQTIILSKIETWAERQLKGKTKHMITGFECVKLCLVPSTTWATEHCQG